MSVNVTQFWDLVCRSRLLSDEQCVDLADQWRQMKGTERFSSARPLAAWLVAENIITRRQSKSLLAGRVAIPSKSSPRPLETPATASSPPHPPQKKHPKERETQAPRPDRHSDAPRRPKVADLGRAAPAGACPLAIELDWSPEDMSELPLALPLDTVPQPTESPAGPIVVAKSVEDLTVRDQLEIAGLGRHKRLNRGRVAWVGGTLAAALVGLCAWIATQREWSLLRHPPAVTQEEPKASTQEDAAKADLSAEAIASTGLSSHTSRELRIPDDGQSLWASPTEGPPLSAAYLPDGSQWVLGIRLAEILAPPEGERILAATGPQLATLLSTLTATTGFRPSEIEQIVVGWCPPSETSAARTGVVLRLSQPITDEELATRLVSASHAVEVASPGPASASSKAEIQEADLGRRGAESNQPTPPRVLLAGDLAIWLPASSGRVVVVHSAEEAPGVIQRGDNPPIFRREMELLLAQSDVDRHFTLVLAPRLLQGDGRDLFGNHAALLREPVRWLVGEKTQALLLSAHWNENFFLELQAIASPEMPPVNLKALIDDHLAELPTRITDHVLTVGIRPYGRHVVSRLPEMVRRMVAYTRSQADGERAVFRCYLPAAAGHNLIMAGELLLAETWAAGGAQDDPPNQVVPVAVEERLEQITSLSFSRDTLEGALDALSRDIGVPIEILGQDLQLEGITKNQSFGIDERERPAREILVAILRLANPDKSATSADDPRQQLVYILRQAATGEHTIYISTRKAAMDRGEGLPKEFVSGE